MVFSQRGGAQRHRMSDGCKATEEAASAMSRVHTGSKVGGRRGRVKNEQELMCTPSAFPAITVGIIKPETWTLLLTGMVSHQTPDRTDLHPVWGTHPLHSTPISLPLFP